MRLQQILFYRELDMPLEEIRRIMAHRDFDVAGALQSHKEELEKKIERLHRLLATVDNTINHLRGKHIMSNKALFAGFTREEEEQYALEAEQRYGAEAMRACYKKWNSYSAAKKESILMEGGVNYMDLVAAMPKGAGCSEVQVIIGRWRKHMDYFWTPNLDQLLGLANGYNDDPRFKANFDRMHPQLAEFMREAVKIYVEKRKK